jgi:hypothetical protein
MKGSTASLLVDILMALGLGVGFWWVADTQLARAHMLDPWNTADLSDYCNAILHLNGDPDVPWSIKRSKITGWLAAPLARSEGIMSALRASSVVAAALVGGGLYLWARAAAGRTAGVLAVLAALALGPLVLLSRILTFYPMVAAFFVVGAALATAGIVSKNPKHLALTGLGVGLALLADVRGLVWAGPWGLAALWAVWRAEDRAQALRWFLAPLAVSYFVARWSFPADAVSLEAQMDVRPLMYMYGSTNPIHAPPWDTGGSFVWGRTMPWDWLATIWFVVQQMQVPILEGFPPPVARFAANNHMTPLMPVWLGSAVLAVISLWRRPRALVAVGATVLPFAIAFHGQANLAEIRVRFLCQILPGLAVISGIALGSAVQGLPALWGRTRWLGLRGVLIVILSAVAVTGQVSTEVSPWARWRRPWPVVSELLVMHPDAGVEATERKRPCVRALAEDAAAGRWIPPLRRGVKVRDFEDPADPTRR